MVPSNLIVAVRLKRRVDFPGVEKIGIMFWFEFLPVALVAAVGLAVLYATCPPGIPARQVNRIFKLIFAHLDRCSAHSGAIISAPGWAHSRKCHGKYLG